MSKPPSTFREFVLVMPATKLPTLHHFAGNPYTGWSWVGPELSGVEAQVHIGFRRLEDAKADVERVHGKVDWRPDIGATWRGDYGPHFTADEWMKASR